MEPLQRESICAAENRDPVLSQVVTQLETGVKPARGDVEGGGCKLLSYWSMRKAVSQGRYGVQTLET